MLQPDVKDYAAALDGNLDDFMVVENPLPGNAVDTQTPGGSSEKMDDPLSSAGPSGETIVVRGPIAAASAPPVSPFVEEPLTEQAPGNKRAPSASILYTVCMPASPPPLKRGPPSCQHHYL